MFQKGVEMLLRGGWVMIPLLVCAFVSVAIMIERSIALRRAAHDEETLVERVGDLIAKGQSDAALTLCQKTSGVTAHVIAAGVKNYRRSPEALERSLQEAAMRELPALNQRLGILDTIITLSPLLGLLGTITGMIQSFHIVATASGGSAAPAITGGVAEALIATATGLAIAITTLPVYNSLTELVREIASNLERRATEFQNVISDPVPVAVSPREVIASHATAATVTTRA